MKANKALVLVALLALACSGCRTAGGSAKSYHQTEKFNLTPQGKPYLALRETKYDKNRIGVKGLLASDEASGLQYTRTNSLGAAAATKVGKFSGKPEPEAIEKAGAAAGQVIGEAGKALVK